MKELYRELTLKAELDDIFAFFGDASNLERLTPPWLNFEILTPQPIEMRVGTLIDYQIQLHGVPIRWRTRISAWNPPFQFIDEQIKGPYYVWRHTHTFTPTDEGVRCTDHVLYQAPLGLFTHRLFVSRDVERIFDYRESQMTEIFKSIAEPQAV